MNLVSGSKLNGRYEIISQLGQGGFGTTFLARDLHLPGNQNCAIKLLKPQATDSFTWQAATRLFDIEAQTLYLLGTHPQIPRLFAYFEENQEFYLVEEYIEGQSLACELLPPFPTNQEQKVISLLIEILEILEFVHQNNVIHRDIKPDNIIRRKIDGKLVLIDFGAVKQITTQISQKGQTNHTISIGTPGYRPSEQANGNPKISSDVYAVGIIGIQGLTGCLPHQLPTDADGEISWQAQVEVSPDLIRVLNKMVRYDFRERYHSATEALQAVRDLTRSTVATLVVPNIKNDTPQKEKPKRFEISPLKIIIFLGIITLSATGSILLYSWMNTTQVESLLESAFTLYQLKRYEEALAIYQKAAKIKPNYPEAWKGQGNVLQRSKRYKEALEAYERAIQIAPDDWQAWIGRAQVLASMEQYEQALEAFEKAIALQPESTEAWQGLGSVQIKLNKYSSAITSSDRLLKLQPKEPSAWYQRGLAYHQLKDYEQAIKSYDQVLVINAYDSQSWYQRGNALMSLKRYQEAANSYEKAVQYQPSLIQAWYNQGLALSNIGRYEAAIAAYDGAVNIKSNYYQAWYERAWAFHQLQRYSEAITSYDRATKYNPNYYQAWYNRGNCFYNLKQYPDAIASYDQALKYKKDYYQAWNSRGNSLLYLTRYPDAIASFEEALRYQPSYPEALEGKERAMNLLNGVVVEPELKDNP